MGLDQRSTLSSFGSPLPILANRLTTWAINTPPAEVASAPAQSAAVNLGQQ
jgi:hypothetical protein